MVFEDYQGMNLLHLALSKGTIDNFLLQGQFIVLSLLTSSFTTCQLYLNCCCIFPCRNASFLQTLRMWITLLGMSFLHGSTSKFSFNSIKVLNQLGMDMGGFDILQNFTSKDTQKMKGTMPQKGPQDHDLLFMQTLIQAIIQNGDDVVDYTIAKSNPKALFLFSMLFIQFHILQYMLVGLIIGFFAIMAIFLPIATSSNMFQP